MNHPVAEAQRRLESWLEGVPLAPPPDAAALLPGSSDMATAELVFSLLVWEAGVPAAVSAARRLAEHFVDLNELRVALVEEVEHTVGLADEHATRRARALVAALTHVFDTEDAVSIDRVARAGPHEGGPYLRAIDALPAFAADRVLLLAFGEHRVPVDGRLLGVLAGRGVVPPDATTARAADLLARCCPAGQARELHLRLEAAAGRVVRASG
ncbi:MAG: hypothetical protein ACIAS6_14700 [Phycisphaerales bacterium JB060]